MFDVIFAIVIGITMLVGAFGTVIPLFPGISLAWGAALVYGFVHGWSEGGVIAFTIISVLAIAAIASNFLLPGRRAEKAGAASTSIVLGVVGAIIGFFVIPVIGLPIGGALGVWLGEKAQRKNGEQAWDATKQTLVGIGLSIVVQFVLALWMAGAWLGWVVFVD